MSNLAVLSLKNRALIALITIVAAIFGGLALTNLKQELIPSIEFPQLSVVTTYPGASPEVVNNDVSTPIETAIQGIAGLESTTIHRHSWDAIMFIESGSGWTEIDGVRIDWKPWDTVHLPSWAWHRHGNANADKPAVFHTTMMTIDQKVVSNSASRLTGFSVRPSRTAAGENSPASTFISQAQSKLAEPKPTTIGRKMAVR